ncbi:MAG: MBL fold metallo-hydrolase [Bacteroidia bacterium]|nr:MBL fold metallo-hydrolase [Bacteroidia bacterium]
MYFKFVYDKTLAQSSYVIGCQKEGIAAVIDPKRDVDTYLKIAEENELKITHILETHIHADFLCGSRELAALTGADLYLSDEGGEDWQYEFPHKGLKNSSQIRLGKVLIEALHTPGHTPEHLSFVVIDEAACDEPVMLFSGDFVFVGDVGRPDLLDKISGNKNSNNEGAYQQFESIQELFKLKDYIQIWPGHGAGSSCGKSIGAVPMSTLGYEKIRNWALQFEDDKEGFVKELLANQPEAPTYYAKMKQLNKEKRPLLTEIPEAKNLSENEYRKAKKSGVKIIDTRQREQYAEGHLAESWNFIHTDTFSTKMGWFMNYDESFLLIARQKETEDLVRKLMRIGMDNLHGFITPAQFLEWEKGNLTTATNIDKKTLETKLNNPDVQLVDVRSETEFKNGRIGNAINVFYGNIPENTGSIPTDKEVIVYCQTGGRATAAYSVLKSLGFDNISIYPGGWGEWNGE